MQALYQYWLLRLTESKLYTDEEGKPDPAIKEAVCESVGDSSHYTIQKSFPTLSGCLLSLMKCFFCVARHKSPCLSKGIYHHLHCLLLYTLSFLNKKCFRETGCVCEPMKT